MEGRVLDDRWEVGARIGEGAWSTVYEGKDRETGDRVAIKALSMELAGWRAEVRDRFNQEAKILALVHAENVVRVRAHGETEDSFLYLVLERLEGETLADRIARAPRLGWREATEIALALARGCASLHERGVVHRDLKPGNVILHREGERVVPKIIDLGISKARQIDDGFATLTATGQVLGTPEYMSFEQARGERDIDARTDVWALGVVLFEMITKKPPFEGANVNAVLAAIRQKPPASLRSIVKDTPAAIDAVVTRCLARPRDERFSDGAALATALEAALIDAAREDRSRRAVIGAAVVIAATIAAASAVFAARGETPKPPVAPTMSLPMVTAPSGSALSSASSRVSSDVPVSSGSASPPLGSANAPAPTASTSAPTAHPSVSARHVPTTRVDNAGF